MNDLDDYKRYLNDDGEIDEQLVREALEQYYAREIEGEIGERLEHALSCEDIRENLLPGEDYETELEAARDRLEEEIRSEVEEEYQDHIDEVLGYTLREFEEQKDEDEEEEAEEGEE